MRTGAAHVAAALRAGIESGELPPGTMLPGAPRLAAAHGVCVATVRTALAMLRREGLTEGVTGCGTFVAGPRTGTACAVEAGLREAMASGALKPGTELPAAAVAARYQVHPDTARTALQALRRAGLVSMPSGRPMLVTGGTGEPWAPRAAVPDPVVERHLEHLGPRGRELSENTVYGRRRFLARLAAELPVPPAEATAGHLARWRAGLTVSPDTASRYLSHCREFYAWLADQGIRPDNPAARLPVPRRRQRLPRPISEAALLRALDGAPPRIRLQFVLAAWCGLRACEIAYLRRESILETASPPVIIVAADATKGLRERIVPLSPFVLAELAAAGLPASGYVFGRLDGQRGPSRPGLISHYANEYLHGLGIRETLHQLRHRFGTQAYRGSRDLLAVRDLMGHASTVTTAGYAAYDRAEAIAAVASIPVPDGMRRPALHAVGAA